MPVYRDKKAGCFVFEFDRFIEGRRIRTRKRLPKTWNHAQADSYDRKESARLYAISTGIQRPEFTNDANLNYEWPCRDGKDSWGNKIEESDLVRDSGHKLDNLGDWSVICRDCAKTHKCVVVALDNQEQRIYRRNTWDEN